MSKVIAGSVSGGKIERCRSVTHSLDGCSSGRGSSCRHGYVNLEVGGERNPVGAATPS
jgi:hypothetical protein